VEPFTVHTGRAVPLRRSNVDTDQIIPSDYLKRVSRTGFGDGLFREWRSAGDFILDEPAFSGATVLLAGADFGTGSSREHAVWALQDAGFRAVISARFADIFRGNALKAGLLAVQLPSAQVEELMIAVEADPQLPVTVDLELREVRVPAATYPFALEDSARHRLLEGLDDIALTLQQDENIAAYEANRPSWLPTTVSA
jgi:3-isopropylmalate/(R)-2-methylmalate dehydratase small subunit